MRLHEIQDVIAMLTELIDALDAQRARSESSGRTNPKVHTDVLRDRIRREANAG